MSLLDWLASLAALRSKVCVCMIWSSLCVPLVLTPGPVLLVHSLFSPLTFSAKELRVPSRLMVCSPHQMLSVKSKWGPNRVCCGSRRWDDRGATLGLDIRNQQVFCRRSCFSPYSACINQHFQVERLPSGPLYSQSNKPASFALCKFNFFAVVSLLKTDVHNGSF